MSEETTSTLPLGILNIETPFSLDSWLTPVSVFPRSTEKRCLQATGDSLLATNNSRFRTYGLKLLNLDLGLRRGFHFVFLIADVRKPIIGADFLPEFRLLVNLSDSALHVYVSHNWWPERSAPQRHPNALLSLTMTPSERI
ncbi:unnamed protein product [Rodentolepis nana]|uniref:Laminin G domain-containing protein n=1 Tax=Rodentolepis nana TaxID=102285 RepID=A0A0R3T5Q5_RODNA|nr:unnamed protein product [Rodentolepis nana]